MKTSVLIMGTEVADKRTGLKAGLLLLLPQVNSKGKMKTSSIGKCEKKTPKQKTKQEATGRKQALRALDTAGTMRWRENGVSGLLVKRKAG